VCLGFFFGEGEIRGGLGEVLSESVGGTGSDEGCRDGESRGREEVVNRVGFSLRKQKKGGQRRESEEDKDRGDRRTFPKRSLTALKSGEESEVVCRAEKRSSDLHICKRAQRRATKEGRQRTRVDSSSLPSPPLSHVPPPLRPSQTSRHPQLDLQLQHDPISDSPNPPAP
jgi:hypothetical protein